jgi:hypothetical protein
MITSLVSGGLQAGSSLIGGSRASSAATQAAQVQAQAAREAAQVQLQIYRDTSAKLEPYRLYGNEALFDLGKLIGTIPGEEATNPLNAPLTAPIGTEFAPTQERLEQTPGYQFVLSQGRNAVTNQLAASGLAGSGAAGKAQTNYAEGLAGTTFQQQFANWLAQQSLTLSQRQQIYNMLGGLASSGQSAAGMTGNFGIQSAAQIGNALTGAAAATASGIVGSANALNAGFSGAGSAISNALLMSNLGMYGGGARSASPYSYSGDFPGS